MRKVKTSSLKSLSMPHANCFVVHILYVCLPSSSLYLQRLTIKQLLDPDVVQLAGNSATPTQTLTSRVRGDWRAVALPALLVCSLFQCAL